MRRFKNILFVADSRSKGGVAFERAVLLAENNQARLMVVDVIPRVTAGIGMPEGFQILHMGFLHRIIRVAVKVLAALMVAVIVWGIGDVIYVLYQRLVEPPFLLLSISDILATFGAFLAVLIAIEIFINITLYLKTDVIPVRLVVATALMAISRKVIIFDFEKITPEFVIGTAAVVLALGITYWLISRKT